MTNKTKKKITDMSPEERKAYNDEKTAFRKTPEFFKETAEKRVQKVLKSLRTVGFMGNYNGTDEQNAAIIEAIDKAVSDMKTALLKESKDKTTFQL